MRFFGGERKEAVMKEDYISITLRLPFFGFFYILCDWRC